MAGAIRSGKPCELAARPALKADRAGLFAWQTLQTLQRSMRQATEQSRGWPGGRGGGTAPVEESPDSMRQRRRVTPGRGNPRESATENRLPGSARAQVKRWGKSPPRDGQPDRHGKPRQEQCQIGASRGSPAGTLQPERPGLAARAVQQCIAQRNGHRWGVRAPEQNPAYRPSAQNVLFVLPRQAPVGPSTPGGGAVRPRR